MSVCAHTDFVKVRSYPSVTLVRCRHCGVIFSDRLPHAPAPAVLYADYYRNEIGGRFGPSVEWIVRAFRFFRAFKIFTISPRARTVLDIGSGRGFMLYFLKKYYRYARTVGTQISRPAYEFSRRRLGLEIYDRDILDLDLPPNSFEIVTLWHVLEHLPEPEKYLRRIAELLCDRGRLVIEVPNYGSWSSRLTGRYWLGLDPDYHYFFFTPATLSDLVVKCGFCINYLHTFSLEYSTFISVQSLVSWLTGTEHLFFQALQSKPPSKRWHWHLILFLLLAPACLLWNLMLYGSRWGEVLLMVAQPSAVPGKGAKSCAEQAG